MTVILTAACTTNTSPLSPTVPGATGSLGAATQSSAPSSRTSAADGSIDRSTPDGPMGDPHVVAQFAAENAGFDAAGDLEVEGTGPIDSVTGSCPAVTITVYGVPVTVSATTTYPLGGGCADLAPGRVARVHGTLFISGGHMTVLASSIGIEGSTNRVVEGEGVVTALSASCPTRLVTIRGLNVQLGSGTTIRWQSGAAATCEDILVGMFLQVAAEVTPAGVILASRIAIQGSTTPPPPVPPGPPTPPPTPTEPVILVGVVSDKQGTCPIVYFRLEGAIVRTSSSTLYGEGTCAQILNGTRVEATGTRATEGNINATRVRFLQAAPPPPPPPTPPTPPTPEVVTVTGLVTARNGTCPIVYFTIGTTIVRTSSSTLYSEGATCAQILNGARVEATGTRATEGAINATRVRLLAAAPPS